MTERSYQNRREGARGWPATARDQAWRLFFPPASSRRAQAEPPSQTIDTLDAAATALGLSRRMIAYYEAGKKPIPRVVALATRALEAV
jgi:hypothetical protein